MPAQLLGPKAVKPRRKTIAQCTPSLGIVSIWWSRCLQCVLQPNNYARSIFYLRDKNGGEIAEVRNALVDSVLRYDAEMDEVTHLFWVDDDVLVFPGALLELLHQDKDIISGVYFQRLEGNLTSPLIYPTRCGGADKFIPNRVYPVWGHGMGLTLIRTEVYKRMKGELDLGLDKYEHPRWYHTSKDGDITQDEKGVFETGFTEDLYFLDNAAKLGYQPWINTNKNCFGFHYDHVKDLGYPQEQWEQWINGQVITWQTPDGPVTWE